MTLSTKEIVRRLIVSTPKYQILLKLSNEKDNDGYLKVQRIEERFFRDGYDVADDEIWTADILIDYIKQQLHKGAEIKLEASELHNSRIKVAIHHHLSKANLKLKKEAQPTFDRLFKVII